MANFKRGKSKRKVRCAICTPFRNGNSFLGFKRRRSDEDFRQQKRDLES